LYFGWRVWATWPSEQERERQREVSKLYDYHFERRRARAAPGGLRLSRKGEANRQRGYNQTNSIAL
jgi:hypothetical protein